MNSLYFMSGLFSGIAGTALSMGADGRFFLLFVASIGMTILAVVLEYMKP